MGSPRSAASLADAFSRTATLTPAEREALAGLEVRERLVRRGGALRRERECPGELYVLLRGMMMSFVLLDDGSRQILRFHFPPDVVGLSGAIYHDSPETLCAVTETVAAVIDRAAFAGLLEAHPRLAALLMATLHAERVGITDRLAAIGRCSAKVRLSALLVELAEKLGSGGNSFVLPLTQEELGDAIGLTAVHVNRMLRQLEVQGLIVRDGNRVTLSDVAALQRGSGYVDRLAGLDLDWLPQGR